MTVLIAAISIGVAAVCGMAALFAAAAITPVPGLFMTAGLVAFLIVDYAGAAWVATRRSAPSRRCTTRRTLFTSSALVLVAAFVLTAVVPPAPPEPEPPVPGQFMVRVSTGSRLAVMKLPAQGEPRRPPIVVLHGGPGVPDLQANARVFGPLTGRGADVYLYAQLGAGDSTRLADPRGYGRDRDVADLEALLNRLNLDRVVLIGHSYGGALAAHYMAGHPDRVAKMVLISPGPLDPADHSSNRATARLSRDQRLGLYSELLAPRGLLGYALLQVNPAAAHAYFPDREADARNDAVIERSEPALHCADAPTEEQQVRGTGFYAMQYPQSATAPPPTDPRAALTGLSVPTLIIKGACDYLSWSSATDYRDRLPRARLIYLRHAGHNAQHDRPALVRSAVGAFLDGVPLPVRPVKGDRPPPGYQGPP